jgi:membrane protein DedA with SNARE-associated domain
VDFPGLVSQYGYYAVLVGAFLEGETVLALAGLAAHRGYLDFWTVTVIAGVAGFLGDQFYFFLGRTRGGAILARFPDARQKAHRFDDLLAKWHAPLIVSIRFLYGFRILGPILLGMGRVPAWKFVVYNAIGAAIWAPLVAGAGWAFGHAVEAFLADVHQYEAWIFAALAVAGGVALLVSIRRDRRRNPG